MLSPARAACAFLLVALLGDASAQGNRFKFTNMGAAIAESQRLQREISNPVALAQTWTEWKAAHGVSYASTADEARGKAAFVQNLQTVVSHNLGPDNGGSSWLEPNRFADLSFQDFSARYLMQPVDAFSLPTAAPSSPVNTTRRGGRKLLAALPTTAVNMIGYTTPVRNQGNCGSCWAFAAVAVAESAVMKAKGLSSGGNVIDISEQQIVNCVKSPNYASAGCNGGYTTDGLAYLTGTAAHGESATGYPSYYGGSGACTAPAGTPVISSWGTTATRSGNAIINQLAAGGAVAVYLNANSKFQLYSGGILPLDTCQGNTINHAVTVVGYGIGASGTKRTNTASSYFTIKNSWGSWGEAGYVRIAADADGSTGTCLMYVNGGMYAVAAPTATQPV